MKRNQARVVLILFSALSVVALWNHGYIGIWAVLFENTATLQVLMDLVIAVWLSMSLVWRDARINGRNPWPWAVLALTAGSIGPLLYLSLYGKVKQPKTAST